MEFEKDYMIIEYNRDKVHVNRLCKKIMRRVKKMKKSKRKTKTGMSKTPYF